MNREQIAKKLIALRGNRSQSEIAKALGITVTSVIDYENGERIPNDSLKIKIAELFKETVDSIFFS